MSSIAKKSIQIVSLATETETDNESETETDNETETETDNETEIEILC